MKTLPYEFLKTIGARYRIITRDDLPVAKGGYMIELPRDWKVDDLSRLNELMENIPWGWCDAGDFHVV